MKEEHVDLLVDPRSAHPLSISRRDHMRGDHIIEGELRDPASGVTYPIINGIPRFVATEAYAGSFGFQWEQHARTQHDRHSGLAISARRFREATRWPASLAGWKILEAGCGSGRFTAHALDTGAVVVSFDISRAVDVVGGHFGRHDRLLIVQADGYALPFRARSFEGVYCFGVLQHAPRPKELFLALCGMVAPGGRIATDIYPKTLGRYWLNTKYWIRPLTRRMKPQRLYRATRAYVSGMWPVARLVRRVPRLGPTLVWRLLVADYSREFPQAPDEQLKQWAILDTFDMLSPAFDAPQTARAFRAWHEQAGLDDIEVVWGHNGFEGRGRAPVTPARAPA